MLSLDKQVDLTCIETDKVAKGKIVRIQGNRVDVALDQGAETGADAARFHQTMLAELMPR
jgi:hypothetical protein